MSYYLKRVLHRLFKKRFIPSLYYDVLEGKHLTKKQAMDPNRQVYILSFGRRTPNQRARKEIEKAPKLSEVIWYRKALPPTWDLRNVNGIDFTAPVGNQGMEGCYSEDTEVLTSEGWKLFKDATLEDDIATCTKDGTIEYHRPVRKFDREYEGPMYHYSQRGLDFNVTPNHMIYARKWNETERTLGEPVFVRADQLGWYMGVFRTGNWIGKDKAFFEIEDRVNKVHPTVTHRIPVDDWLWFLGIYIAEGCVVEGDSDYRIEIAASHPRKRAIIEEHLRRLPWHIGVCDDRFRIFNKRLFEILVPLGQAKEKYVPEFIKTLPPHRIEIFLDGFTTGDGHEGNYGGSDRTWLYTSSKKLADDLQELLLKTGRCGNIRTRSRFGGVLKGRQIGFSTAYEVEIKQRAIANLLPENFEIESYKGHVYCFEVPNHTMYVRRKGTPFWCGNSCTGFGAYGMKGSGERLSETFQEDVSQRMIYNDARNRGGLLNSEGAYMIDVMNALVEDGVCRSHYWPYEANHDNSWPPPNGDALVDGLNWRVDWFVDCAKEADPVEAIKQALYQLGAVNIGSPWMKSWELPWNGQCPVPPDNDEVLGGHSWVIIGWDDLKGVFYARNSWGTTWGNRGDFEFPYETLTCKAWQDAGGYEAYKTQDSASILCPDGQHYDSAAGECVPDGESPNPPDPTTCESKCMDCMTAAMNETDFWTLLVDGVTCILNYYMCAFGISYSMTKKTSGKGDAKKLTLTFKKKATSKK